MSGPGVMASPDCSADHPHTSCCHRTMESSIPPKDAEKTAATIVDPVKARIRNSAGSISGFVARRV